MRHGAILAVTLALGSGLAASAHAAIVSVTPGTVIWPTPTGTVGASTYGGQFAHAWNEKQGVLVSGLAVDNVGSTGNSNNNASPGLISGVVDVHMIHKEPIWPLGSGSLQGTVTFNNPVVGVVWTAANLNASDAVCSAGTTYSTSPVRGIALGIDWVVVSGSTVSFSLPHGNFPQADYAQIRVLTAVPAPGAGSLLAAGGMFMVRRRRR